MEFKIAIVGATGVVGRTLLSILGERNLLDNKYVLYASQKSRGKRLRVGEKYHEIKELNEGILDENFDFAIFCTREIVSREFVKKLAKRGAIVIDFSSYYRKKYPLIVPEINGDKIGGGVLCNPNCSTIAGVMALYNIHRKYGLKRVVYSTYQAVSGAGKEGLNDLKNGNNKCSIFSRSNSYGISCNNRFYNLRRKT